MTEYVNFHTVAAFLNALVLGSMVFFAAVVTPVAFKALEQPGRSAYLRALFPLYYRVLAAASALAALFIWYRVEAIWLGLNAAAFLAADQLIRPRIERHRAGRERGDAADTRAFRRLHRLSVYLNLLQLIVALVVFFRLSV